MAEDYSGSGFNEGLIRENTAAEDLYDNVSVESLLADNAINGNKVVELDFAKITNVEITNAQIESVSASKITAGTITSESIILAADGSGDAVIRAGKTDFTNSETGFILGIDDSDSDKPKFFIGDTTKYLNWDGSSLTIRGTLNADDITAGTIVGRTLKANGGVGADVWIDNSGTLSFYYGGNNIGYIGMNSSSQMMAHSDNDLYLQSGDVMALDCGSSFYVFADAGMAFDFNNNGGSDIFLITDNGSTTAYFTDGGDLWVADNVSSSSFTDRTPFYDGDAVKEIRKIKGKTVNGKLEIDHDSLPSFIRSNRKKKRIEKGAVKGKYIVTGEDDVVERDLGATISVLLKAVAELDERLDVLEKGKKI